MSGMKSILSASQTAKIIGCSEQMVRERMKRGIWAIGIVVPPKKKDGNYTYEVIPRKLADMIEISMEELERRLEA